MSFTASHRGGEGAPLVLLHGLTDTWRTWEPVLPALERRFEVFAPTLAGHAGGAAFGDGEAIDDAIIDVLVELLDAATLRYFRAMAPRVREAAPRAQAIAATPEGRGRATAAYASNADHVSADLVAHLIRGGAACDPEPLLAFAEREGWRLEPERVTGPLRFVWGTEDQLLALPAAASRYRAEFPQAEWIEIEGAGHCPQLDHPIETAELIAGFST